MGNELIEPPAEMRTMAATAMQIYMAYIEAGFTPNQALELTKVALAIGSN